MFMFLLKYVLCPCLIIVLLCICFCFFFKQKTAYEMRISDWSSDVCSSDLCGREDRDNGSPVALADLLPNGRFAEIPGTHMSCVTMPELGNAMADFLNA